MTVEEELKNIVEEQLKQIFDPEIPINIFELGLIYEINFSNEFKDVNIIMTLTAPNCPEAERLPVEVHDKVMEMGRFKSVDVQIVFEPSWTIDLMSEEAKFELGLD